MYVSSCAPHKCLLCCTQSDVCVVHAIVVLFYFPSLFFFFSRALRNFDPRADNGVCVHGVPIIWYDTRSNVNFVLLEVVYDE